MTEGFLRLTRKCPEGAAVAGTMSRISGTALSFSAAASLFATLYEFPVPEKYIIIRSRPFYISHPASFIKNN